MKKLKFIVFSAFLILFVALPALAETNPDPCQVGTFLGNKTTGTPVIKQFLCAVGIGSFGKDTVGYSQTPGDPLAQAVGRVINWVLGLLGIVLTLLILYAGYLWFSARGNEEQVTKAKDLLTQAVIGLVIVFGAYAISYFVFYRLTLATQTNITVTP